MYGKGSMVICKSCGQRHTAKSDISAFIVCSRCFYVNDKIGDRQKNASALPEDMSMIQIGTKGKTGTEEFEVIGRYKIDAEEGYYNLWVIHFQKGDRLEWLIDSFGEYIHATGKKLKEEDLDENIWKSNCGLKFDLADLGEYRLISKPVLFSQYMEGELPEFPEDVKLVKLLELAKGEGMKALLVRGGSDALFCIAGSEIEWSGFNFVNHRKFNPVGN